MESKTSFQKSKLRNQQLLTAYADLHLPPSLDQSYYLGLIDTRSRDDDQVITKVLDLADSQTMPSADLFSGLLGAHSTQETAAEIAQPDKALEVEDSHIDNSRLLMVPQLWLLKLDSRKWSFFDCDNRVCLLTNGQERSSLRAPRGSMAATSPPMIPFSRA